MHTDAYIKQMMNQHNNFNLGAYNYDDSHKSEVSSADSISENVFSY
jgi:hypothetical protein